MFFSDLDTKESLEYYKLVSKYFVHDVRNMSIMSLVTEITVCFKRQCSNVYIRVLWKKQQFKTVCSRDTAYITRPKQRKSRCDTFIFCSTSRQASTRHVLL